MGLISRYELFREKTSISISEATAYLFNNFLPFIKKQKEIYENINNSYLKRTRISPDRFVSLVMATSENVADFEDWWTQTTKYFIAVLHEKPLDYQRLKGMRDQLEKGLQKYFNNYKTFLESVPPDIFLIAKEELTCIEETTESIFGIADELERLSNLPKDQLKDRIDADGVIRFNYSLFVSKQAIDEAVEEFRIACRKARGR